MKRSKHFIGFIFIFSALVSLTLSANAQDDSHFPNAFERSQTFNFISPQPPAEELENRNNTQFETTNSAERVIYQAYENRSMNLYLDNSPSGSSNDQHIINLGSGNQTFPSLNMGATKVAYSSDETGNYEIYVFNLEDQTKRQLTSHRKKDIRPKFLPNGELIAFETERNGNSDIYLMSSTGTDVRPLISTDAYEGMSSWSPDGTKLAFVSNVSGGYRIYVYDFASNLIQQITDVPFSLRPNWSPDGSRILFDADVNNDGWQELVVINADGSNQKVLANGRSHVDYRSFAWSQDPDNIYAIYAQVYYVEFKGDYYIQRSTIFSLREEDNSSIYQINISSRIILSLSWAVQDIFPPNIEFTVPNQKYTHINDGIRWGGEEPNGPIKYQLEAKVEEQKSDWVPLIQNTTESTFPYIAQAGDTVSFRLSGADKYKNFTNAQQSDYAKTTFYQSRLTGQVLDNRGGLISGAAMDIHPTTLNNIQTLNNGSWHGFTTSSDIHTLGFSEEKFAHIEPINLEEGKRNHIYIQPKENLIQNGSFEIPESETSYWNSNEDLSILISEDSALSGSQGIRLGETCVVDDCLDSKKVDFTRIMDSPYNLSVIDKKGLLHMFKSGNGNPHYWNSYLGKPSSSEIKTDIKYSNSSQPLVVADDFGHLHAVWTSDTGLVYGKRQSNNLWITELLEDYGFAEKLLIGDDGTIHLIYHNSNISNNLIYRFKKVNHSWSERESINRGGRFDPIEAIIDSNNQLHIAWVEERDTASHPRGIGLILYQTRLPNGVWQPAEILPEDLVPDVRQVKRLFKAPNGYIHLFVHSSDYSPSHLIKSGPTWSEPIMHTPSWSVNYSDVCMDSDGIFHVFGAAHNYEENTNGLYYGQLTKNIATENLKLFELGEFPGDRYDSHLVCGPNDNLYLMQRLRFSSIESTVLKKAKTDSTHTISQTVSIPASMKNPTLTFMYKGKYESSFNLYSHFYASVESESAENSLTRSFFHRSPNWQLGWADLSEWAGETVTITLGLKQMAGETIQWVDIDNISIGPATPNLWIEFQPETSSIPLNEIWELNLSFGNASDITGANPKLSFTLPDMVQLVSASVQPTVNESNLSWDLDDLEKEESDSIRLSLRGSEPLGDLFLQSLKFEANISTDIEELYNFDNSETLNLIVANQLYLPIINR